MHRFGALLFHDSLFPMQQTAFFDWVDLLDLAEKNRPRAYNLFYGFHSVYGLKEGDLCPSERLADIERHSPCDFQQLVYDFTAAALPYLTGDQLEEMEREINSEGISFEF
jgi:hypothetical protein